MIAGLAAGLFALYDLWVDAMIHFHFLYADYPNPNGQGLKGVVVSTPELLLSFGKTAVCLGLGFYVWHRLRSAERLAGA